MVQKTTTTKPTKNKWVKKMKYPVIVGASLLGGMGAYGSSLSGGTGSFLDNIRLGTSSLFSGLSGGSSPTSQAKSSSGSGGGIGGFFSNMLGGLFGGEGRLAIGDIIGGIGGFFGAKAKHELDERTVAVNEEQVKINRLKAEAAIDAEKRQTAIASTFMGHTNPIAAVEGVNVEPGLVVADTWVTPEVRKQAGGAIGGSQSGIISQADQRKLV